MYNDTTYPMSSSTEGLAEYPLQMSPVNMHTDESTIQHLYVNHPVPEMFDMGPYQSHPALGHAITNYGRTQGYLHASPIRNLYIRPPDKTPQSGIAPILRRIRIERRVCGTIIDKGPEDFAPTYDTNMVMNEHRAQAESQTSSVLSGQRAPSNDDTSALADGDQVYPVRASIELFGMRLTLNSHFGMRDLAPTRPGDNRVGSVRRFLAVLLKRIADTLVPDNVDVTGMEV